MMEACLKREDARCHRYPECPGKATLPKTPRTFRWAARPFALLGAGSDDEDRGALR